MADLSRRWTHLREAWQQDQWLGVRCLVYKHQEFQQEKKYVRRKYEQLKLMQKRREQQDADYHQWFIDSLPDEQERKRQSERVFSHQVTILIPAYNTSSPMLRELVRSLQEQTCGQWKAIVYDGASTNEGTKKTLRHIAKADPRIQVVFGQENLGISGNTNRALELVETEYVALCDHDDLLTCDAVYWLLDAFENGADFAYSDEDKCDEWGNRFFDPHFKSDFAPDSLRSGNYICHLMGMRTELMRRAGGLRSKYDGSQDHDLALRATELAACIAHIPRVLYHWRMVSRSFSHAASERCARAAARAVSSQLERQGLEGGVELDNLHLKVVYPIPEDTRVSLIVHGIHGRQLPGWLCLLLENTEEDLERIQECILVGSPLPAKIPSRIRALGWRFLSADSLQDAAQKASGNVLLFLEQGMQPREPEWLHRGLMMATRPWIGQAGGGIVDQNTNYLSFGYAVDTPHGAVGSMGGESCFGITFQLYDHIVRNVSAISSCYLMMRRDVFLKYQRFDEFSSDLGSVALGLECIRHQLYNVVYPHGNMLQAGKSQVLLSNREPADLKRFIQLYGEHPKEHYYSPHFERSQGGMSLELTRHVEAETSYTVTERNG